MKRFGKCLSVCLVVLGSLFLVTGDAAFARGGSSSSGSRSSGSSWGGSRSTPSAAPKPSAPSSGWGGSKSTPSTPAASPSTPSKSSSSWGGNKSTPAVANTRTAAEQKAYESAKMQGKAFDNKDAAVKDFQTKNSTKYSSTFDKEPPKRPEHIPSTYSSGGRSYNVVYDPIHRGYGYYGPGGAWIMYDAMRDAAMMSVLMNHNGYYVGSPVAYGQPGTVYVDNGSHGWGVFWTILIIIVVGAVVVSIYKSRL